MTKIEILMNKPVYLGLSILELSKILMYEVWYVYVKPKCSNEVKLCCMYTETVYFIQFIHKNRWYLYKGIAEDVLKLDLILYDYDKLWFR